jgi:EAL domain-containing protein (putative c-di-GMP-specific phosphodiesterase class I)
VVVRQGGPADRLRVLDWPELLDAALLEGGIETHYQPIVDLVRGVVVGYEGLARFTPHSPGGPAVAPSSAPPVAWFEAALTLGRVPELEAAAIRAAFAGRTALPINTFLTVNVGPDVLEHPAIREVLSDQGDLGGVVIELTEHARVDSYLALEPSLERWRSAGAMFALDDAGSGYAGFQHLLQIRPEIIKLDRALVASVDRDEGKRSLVEMLGAFAGRIDAWLLAEGVETLQELETVARLGVPLAQGYYLARPGPAWPQVSDVTGRHLRSLASPSEEPTLSSLIESARTASDAASAAEVFRADDCDLVVVLDAHGRPVATVGERGLLSNVRVTSLQVSVDTLVADAARRAMQRPDEHRFHPIVCTDDTGRFMGLVRMERVLEFLAAQAG